MMLSDTWNNNNVRLPVAQTHTLIVRAALEDHMSWLPAEAISWTDSETFCTFQWSSHQIEKVLEFLL